MQPALYGYGLSLVGILILTPDTLCLRLMSDTEDSAVMFWRYTISAVSILLFMLTVKPRRVMPAFANLGVLGLFAGALWGVSNYCFTAAVQNTAAANVLVINASNTIFSAIFAYFLVGDAVRWRTVVTTLVCFGAIVLVFSSELGGGSDGWVGNVYAVGAAVSLGLYLPLCRYKSMKTAAPPPPSPPPPLPLPSEKPIPADPRGAPDPMVDPAPEAAVVVAAPALNPALVAEPGAQFVDDDVMEILAYNVVAGFVVAIIAAGIGADPRAVASRSVPFLVVNGILVLGCSFCLLSVGPLYIPAAEVSLMFLVETVLGPVWVYLAGYEAPPAFTVYGGIAMILALGVNSGMAIREERKATAVAADNVPQHGADDDIEGTKPAGEKDSVTSRGTPPDDQSA